MSERKVSKNMELALDELHDYLKEHNAAIIRSADSNNKLVLSVLKPEFINDEDHCDNEFETVEFTEDIGSEAIEYGWFE